MVKKKTKSKAYIDALSAAALKNYNILTHEILLRTMPFGSGWLCDDEDPLAACAASVTIGTALYATRRSMLGAETLREPPVN